MNQNEKPRDPVERIKRSLTKNYCGLTIGFAVRYEDLRPNPDALREFQASCHRMEQVCCKRKSALRARPEFLPQIAGDLGEYEAEAERLGLKGEGKYAEN